MANKEALKVSGFVSIFIFWLCLFLKVNCTHIGAGDRVDESRLGDPGVNHCSCVCDVS